MTDRSYWVDYWKKSSPGKTPERPFFADLVSTWPRQKRSFIEIGGFPGLFAAYFHQRFGYDVTVLDFLVLPEVIHKVEQANGIPCGTIRSIEADFLAHDSKQKFDVVFSAGFIEHFPDTRQLLLRHRDYVAPGGTLFISMPNFRGINGWVQWLFDRTTYKAHNIEAMNLRLLKRHAAELGAKKFEVFYHGQPHLWLDHPERVPPWARFAVRLTSALVSRMRLKNRLFSPHIVLIAHF